MNLLIVTEKPSVARAFVKAFEITYKLKFSSRKGKSRYNTIFESPVSDGENIEFKIEDESNIIQKSSSIIISSVLGHLLNFEYEKPFDKESDWRKNDPEELIQRVANFKPINEPLVNQMKDLGIKADVLCIGTDNDGHGESIGNEIAEIIKEKNPSILTSRMRFTSTRPYALKKAFENQVKLDVAWVSQVDSLRRQDLRMGASLTRFLTVGTQKEGLKSLISYGPCQSSTLWIITNRYLEKTSFEPQKFWELLATVKYKDQGKTKKCEFKWKEGRIFEESKIDEVYTRLKDINQGKITKIEDKEERIKRPLPLDTDTLESEGARYFKTSPKNIADIAEMLYNNGFITYPRTESSFYLEKDLSPLVKEFQTHSEYGSIADKVLKIGNTSSPSKGKFSKDHEPIRPARSAEKKEISAAIKGNQWQKDMAWKIYNYVILRFMATVHEEGKLATRQIELAVEKELFEAKGKTIIKMGFLDIYPFRRVQESELPPLKVDEETPLTISKREDWTKPPSLWTDSSIIREMARLGIGTDATQSTHIETVVSRGFVTVEGKNRSMIPTSLGQAFYEVFINYAPDLIKPEIRGRIEGLTQNLRELKIKEQEVDSEVIKLLKEGFKNLKKSQKDIFSKIATSGLTSTKNSEEGNYGNCLSCNSPLEVRIGKNSKRFIACSNSECRTSFPLPKKGTLHPLEKKCVLCGSVPFRVGDGTRAWNLCPSCWMNKASDKDGPYFCSKCKEEKCDYSGSHEKEEVLGELGKCPQKDCSGNVTLTLDGARTIVSCDKCKKEWTAPNLKKGTKISVSRECRLCNLKTLEIRRFKKSPYNMCVICGEFCFKCKYKCFE